MVTNVVRAELRYRPTKSEIAEGYRLVTRAAHPIASRIRSALIVVFAVLALALGAMLFAVPEDAPGAFATMIPALLVYLAIISPWSVSWLHALGRRSADHEELESFSPQEIRLRSSAVNGGVAPSAFRFRLESERLFVFGNETGAVGPLVPKRIFPNAAMRDAFREMTIDKPSSLAVVAAVRALGEDPGERGVMFTLDPEEHMRGSWLLFRYTSPLRARLAALAFALFVLAVVVHASIGASAGGSGIFVGAFLVVVFAFSRWKARRRLATTLVPVTLRVDDQGIATMSAANSLAITWGQALGYLDVDPRLLIVVIRPGFGFLFPTRVLPVALAAQIKGRLAPFTR